ncbi:MAG TPA: two-component regulator propeller domain-containing protein [Salinivirgaceae bacterium]|nr:two-component regulator propeller domain-containing protein [Salinivirgaceae bacterium]
MKPRSYAFLLFILIAEATLGSKYSQLQFRSYTIENGLPVGTVWTVYQDSCGFIWFGLDNGLTRFDGLQFKTYTTHGEKGKTLSNDKIYDIVQGYGQKLYFATAEGITVFDKISGTFYDFPFVDTLLRRQPFRAIIVESDSTLLAATQISGAIRIFLSSRKTEPLIEGGKTFYARNIFIDSQKLLWISTYGKGFYVKSPNNTFEQYLVCTDKTDPNDYEAKNRVNQIFEYTTNLYWILTERGLYEFNFITKEIKPVDLSAYIPGNQPPTRFRKIIRDRNQNLWISTYQGLLFLENGNIQTGHLFTAEEDNPYSLSSNRSLNVMEDRAGSIWISNYDVGVNVLHSIDVKFHYFSKTNTPNSLPANIVTAFEKYDQHKILIGTIGGGLSLFDSRTELFTAFTHRQLNDRILSIYKENQQSIWLGTWGGGLQHFNTENNKVTTYQKEGDNPNSLLNNTVICLVPDNHWLWIGTFGGLNLMDLRTRKIERVKALEMLNNTPVYAIYKNRNKLYIGTNGKGLIIYDVETQEVEQITKIENNTASLASNTIHHISKDQNNPRLFLGTDKGLSILDLNTSEFISFDETNGLSNNKVWSVIQDKENNLWLSTNRGITRINLSIELSNPDAFKIYSKKDGLRTLEFSQGSYLFDTINNLIFYGGTQGFYFFDPQKIKPRTYNPKIQITSIKVMDNEYQSDTSVTYLRHLILPYNKNFIAFEFVSLDYFDPSNNLFQFKVVGQSNLWTSPSTRNYVSFPDLKEGRYELIIRGTNSEGFWSNDEKRIRITINPPWYRTNIAYVIYIISLILGILGFVQWRTYNLEKEKRILETIVAERTKELRQKNLDITASIQYAQRIQQAIINPKISEFLQQFPDAFVFFRPKDIVSGDFFWYGKNGNRRFFAAADCTGHGVPGAFMSIIGVNLLEKAIIEHNITEPHLILDQIDQDIKVNLNQYGRKNDTFDGMDIALCAYDLGTNILFYAGAYRPLIQITNGELIQHKPTRASIGGSQIQKAKEFFTHTIQIQPNDVFYIFSDGMTDQFGGKEGRKISSNTLHKIFLEVYKIPMVEQEIYFENMMKEWLSGYSQIDDIILTGIRFGRLVENS